MFCIFITLHPLFNLFEWENISFLYCTRQKTVLEEGWQLLRMLLKSTLCVCVWLSNGATNTTVFVAADEAASDAEIVNGTPVS